MNATTDLERLLRDAPLPLIAARARRARKDVGLSHDALGARCGLTRQQLIRIEKADHRPRIGTLLKLASGTGKAAEWFVDPEIEMSPFRPDEKAA